MHGYETPFTSVDELNRYFAQDELVCLVCGEAFIRLPAHLRAKHHYTPEDYKAEFGIPKQRGLAGKASRDAQAERFIHLRKIGKVTTPSVLHMEMLHNMRRGVKQKVLPVHVDAIRQAKKDRPFLTEQQEKHFLNRIEQGRGVMEVLSDEDMPSHATFLRHLRLSSSFCVRFACLMEHMPFQYQIQQRRIGENLKLFIVLLRELEELPWHEIDYTLLISKGSASRIYNRLFKQEALPYFRRRIVEELEL